MHFFSEMPWMLAGIVFFFISFKLWLKADTIVRSKYHLVGYSAFNVSAVLALACFLHKILATGFGL